MQGDRSKSDALVSGAVVAVVGTLLTLPFLRIGFLGDDVELLVEALGAPDRPPSFRHDGGILRPVVSASLRFDHALGGTSPVGYHVTNLVLHIVDAWLVMALTWRLAGDRTRRWLPLVAGLVFVALPTHTEAVGWIAGRGDLLVALGCLSSLLLWLDPHGHRWCRFASVAAFAVAALSKESALVFPAVVVLAERWQAAGVRADGPDGTDRPSWSTAVTRSWPFVAVVAGFLVLRAVVRGDADGGYLARFGDEGPLRVLVNGPLALARTIAPGAPLLIWAIAGIVALSTIALVRSALRRPQLLFTAVAAGVLVLPILPLGVSEFDTRGERFVYLPSALVVAGVVAAWAHRRRFVPAVAVAVALGIAAQLTIAPRWTEAGEVAASLDRAVDEWPVDRDVVMLVTPDSVQGAYVDRNLIAPTAWLLHRWSRGDAIVQASSVRLHDADDLIEVEPDRSCEGCWIVRLSDDTEFVDTATPGSSWEVDGITATRISDRVLRIEVGGRLADAPVWFWSNGRVVPASG